MDRKSHPSIASFITVRLTKKKKTIVVLLISIFFILCLSLPYTKVHFTINNHDLHQYHHEAPVAAAPGATTTSTALSKQTETQETIEQAEVESEEERYLAYLPHSGLSNQRIELANSLLLAYMLNRTLIVPPAFLGTVFGWMPRGKLSRKLEWLTTPKNFNKLCQPPTAGRLASYVVKSQCEEYRHFGIINWSELHDFDPLIDAGIRIKFQTITSMTQIKESLNITHDDQIYLHNDVQLYDWRLYENKSEAKHLLENQLNYFDSFGGRRFYQVLLPRHFQQRTEKLLYLGGIFGSTRFTLISPEYKLMQQKIANVLHYRLDTPLGETVKAIVNYLGGKGTFMSLHFRTGDKPFKNEISTNLDKFMENMTNLVGGGGDYDSSSNHECLNIDNRMNNQQQLQEQSQLTTLGNRVKVYIATDHHAPRSESSEILPWFDEFPCTTTLDDLPDYLFAPLDNLRDIISPTKPLRKYLIPLVDAMVAAHGKIILTTPRSTFSKYIEELHHAWL